MKREQFDVQLKEWASKREVLGKNSHRELAEFISYIEAEALYDDGVSSIAEILSGGCMGYNDYTAEKLADEVFSVYFCCDEDDWFFRDLIERFPI